MEPGFLIYFSDNNRNQDFPPSTSFEFSDDRQDYSGNQNSFHHDDGTSFKSEINDIEASSTSNKINLQEFLEENGETPASRFIFGGNREGASCTTPSGIFNRTLFEYLRKVVRNTIQ